MEREKYIKMLKWLDHDNKRDEAEIHNNAE